MNRARATLGPILILGGALLAAPPARAWEALTNPPSVWQTLPVPYWLSAPGCADVGGFDPTASAVEASFDAWEVSDCTAWRVSFQGATDAQPYDAGDGREVLGWEEGSWPWDRSAIGITQVMFGSGRLRSADIAFNAVDFAWSLGGGDGAATVDVQSIATHEIGHFLGLDDLYACSSDPQTMCGYYSGGDAPRSLTPDDVAGVCSLYPGGGPPPGCVDGSECGDRYDCVAGACVGRMCARCATHDDCGGDGDFCLLGFADGNHYCGAACVADAQCGDGARCFNLGGIRQCLPGSLDCAGTAPRCLADGDCPGGYVCRDGACVAPPPPACDGDGDCAAGLVCRDGACVPDPSAHLPVCAECASDDDCGGDEDACVGAFPDGTLFSDGRSHCGRACDPGEDDCGEGLWCWEFDEHPAQCLPENKECASCDPVAMAGCGDGLYCDAADCVTGICRPGAAGARGLGEPCVADADCRSLQCAEQTGRSYCTATCVTSGEERCPAPFTCQQLEYNSCGYCSCAAGRMGDACAVNTDCEGGACFTLPDHSGKACSMFCGGVIGCPGGFACKASPDGILGCFPELLRPGQTCSNPAAPCLGGWCDVAQGVCTRSCEAPCACPPDMRCATGPDGARSCVKGGVIQSGCDGCALTGAPAAGVGAPAALLLLLLLFSTMILKGGCPRSGRGGLTPEGCPPPAGGWREAPGGLTIT